MKHMLDSINPIEESRKRLASANLKCCPLCGAVNARQNQECFVCAWAGEFDTNPESVEKGLNSLLQRCPELADLLNPPPTRWQRVKQSFQWFLRRVFHTRVDTYA
jgi:hypothetical protein